MAEVVFPPAGFEPPRLGRVHDADDVCSIAITPPGSKSQTNRLLILAALSDGVSTLHNPLVSEDTTALGDALATLGAKVVIEGTDWFITGVNGCFPRGGSVNLGDGGTPTRFMLAAAALADDAVVVDGSERMRERPVDEGIALLREFGVKIDAVGDPPKLPARVHPMRDRTGGVLRVGRTASSQFLSAMLLIGPWLRDGVTIEFNAAPTSETYLQLTLAALRDASADVPIGEGYRVMGKPLTAFECDVEPDASSAIYWWAAAAISPGVSVTIAIAPNSAQPDIAAVAMLEAMGALVERNNNAITVRGPDQLCGVNFNAEQCPDAAVMLAVVGACATSPSRIDGLHTLRVKETDRIHALACELVKLGCGVEEHDDALTISPVNDKPARALTLINTWNDHRMAMAFGILALREPGLAIEDPSCVAKSYPGFWADRADLLAQIKT